MDVWFEIWYIFWCINKTNEMTWISLDFGFRSNVHRNKVLPLVWIILNVIERNEILISAEHFDLCFFSSKLQVLLFFYKTFDSIARFHAIKGEDQSIGFGKSKISFIVSTGSSGSQEYCPLVTGTYVTCKYPKFGCFVAYSSDGRERVENFKRGFLQSWYFLIDR